MVADGAFSHKIDYVPIFEENLHFKDILVALLGQSYGNFGEWGDVT